MLEFIRLVHLKCMGINYDDEEYIQSKMISEHVIIAKRLLENGNAYKCYCSAEEIEEQKLFEVNNSVRTLIRDLEINKKKLSEQKK